MFEMWDAEVKKSEKGYILECQMHLSDLGYVGTFTVDFDTEQEAQEALEEVKINYMED